MNPANRRSRCLVINHPLLELVRKDGFSRVHDPPGRDRAEAVDRHQGKRCASGMVSRWRETVVLQQQDGIQTRGRVGGAPQPYGKVFVMRYDGTDVEQITDNQWEKGGPAWQPNNHVVGFSTSSSQ